MLCRTADHFVHCYIVPYIFLKIREAAGYMTIVKYLQEFDGKYYYLFERFDDGDKWQ